MEKQHTSESLPIFMKISFLRTCLISSLVFSACNYNPLVAAPDATKDQVNALTPVTAIAPESPAIPTALSLNTLFGDHMVLQRDVPANIWGQAAPGEKIRLSLNGEVVTTTTDSQGNWRAKLPTQAAGGPHEIRITGKTAVTLHDVVFGDVWLMSGQSNMEGISKTMLKPEVLATESATANDPQLRFFTVGKNLQLTPTRQLKGQWHTSTPQTMPDFSAVAYFFGRELRRKLKVPIGLINSSWGGTTVEAFTSIEALEKDPAYPALKNAWSSRDIEFPQKMKLFEESLAKWQADTAKAQDQNTELPRRPNMPWGGPKDNQRPSALYNGMIAPLLPYSIKGIAWYQGEANADTIAEAITYRTLFPTVISDWRAKWGNNLPFLFVQLANYRALQVEPVESQQAWPYLREAQQMALKLPNTGMASAMGNEDTETAHPRDKVTVGKRLADVALGMVYGQNVPYTGPLFHSMKVEGNVARVKFTHAEGGLKVRGGDMLRGFAIAGTDRKFVWANAKIDGDNVVLWSSQVKAPVMVRYGWADNPIGNLYNGAGLPASPFRTDERLTTETLSTTASF
jgi:sialate O-acetylesterase